MINVLFCTDVVDFKIHFVFFSITFFFKECHHQGVLTAWILWTLFCYPSLLTIFLGKSSRWYRVSGVSMCWSPLKNIAYKLILTSPAVPSISCSFYLFVRWEVNGCTSAVLWCAASRICSEQHVTSLCTSHLAFSPGILLKFKWCDHTIVLSQLQFGKIPILFHQRSEFHMVINLLIIVHVLPICILTLFLIDEM